MCSFQFIGSASLLPGGTKMVHISYAVAMCNTTCMDRTMHACLYVCQNRSLSYLGIKYATCVNKCCLASHAHTHIYTHARAHAHTRTRTRTYTRSYAHIHTHAPPPHARTCTHTRACIPHRECAAISSYIALKCNTSNFNQSLSYVDN
jgi:hypothetical protein